jgi:hypothetical protein
VDKPAPIFQRRNNTRVVVRGRGTRVPAASARSTSILTTTTAASTTEIVEIRPTRRGIRRKTTAKSSSTPNNLSVIPVSRNAAVAITRRPFTKPTTTATTTTTVRTTQKPTTRLTTTTTTTERAISSEEVSDDVANILPAITSARPRPTNYKNQSSFVQQHQHFTFDSSTEGFVPFIPNFLESTAESLTREQVPATYDQYLQQQYKIKGLDVESQEEEQSSYNEDEKLIGVLGSQVSFLQVKL